MNYALYNNTIDLSIPDTGFCQYIKIKKRADDDAGFGKSASYDVVASSDVEPGGVRGKVQITMPYKEDRKDLESLSCKLETSTSTGDLQTFRVEAEPVGILARFLIYIRDFFVGMFSLLL